MESNFKQRQRRYADLVTARKPQAALRKTAQASEPEPAKLLFSSRKKKFKMIWILAATTVIVAVASCFLYTLKDSTPLDDYVKRFDFPLYYPAEMPRNYTLNEGSIQSSATVLLYSLENKNENKKLIFSLQPLPSGFDATAFIRKGSTPIISSVGTLYATSIDGKSQYMLTTAGGTLVVINASSKVDDPLINTLVSNLKEVKK